MFNIAVFVSGRGSNLRAIYKKIEQNQLYARIAAVVGNKECDAIRFAIDKGIKTFIIGNKKEFVPINNKSENVKKNKTEVSFAEIKNILQNLNTDLVVLAGFLKKIPADFISAFENKIINIHPALLPKYGGKGMYGMNVHKAVFEAKEILSGATVHYVNEKYDEGKIIEQRTVNVSDVESPEEIAERVLKIEHNLLPEVIKKIAEETYIEKVSVN